MKKIFPIYHLYQLEIILFILQLIWLYQVMNEKLSLSYTDLPSLSSLSLGFSSFMDTKTVILTSIVKNRLWVDLSSLYSFETCGGSFRNVSSLNLSSIIICIVYFIDLLNLSSIITSENSFRETTNLTLFSIFIIRGIINKYSFDYYIYYRWSVILWNN